MDEKEPVTTTYSAVWTSGNRHAFPEVKIGEDVYIAIPKSAFSEADAPNDDVFLFKLIPIDQLRS